MLKPVLILALAATQLLAGTCGSLYLCISHDGTHWCVDLDPAACDCCRGGESGAIQPDLCCEDQSTSCDAAAVKVAGMSVEDPCRCTHLLIYREQPSLVLPASAISDAPVLSGFVALHPPLWRSDNPGAARSARFDQSHVEPIPSQPLVILSTIVMRC